MDVNKFNSKQISKPHVIQRESESLLTNPKFSDVSFLVEDELICVHKLVLSLASPVFEKMFYGDLKTDTTQPIQIPDITAIGFKNMLKYIYTNKLEFEFQYFYEVYLAADKYLVYHMTDELIDYLILDLKVSNCCLIYDQLMNFENVNLLQLDSVKKMIIGDTKEAFESECFTKIQPSTLISLLNFDELSISELDLLKACWRLVDYNVTTLENDSSKESKRKFFEQFKNFIRFDNLDPNSLANFDGIQDLLTDAEIGQLFLHLHNPKMPLNIKCLTNRINGLIHSVSFNSNEGSYRSGTVIHEFKVDRNVNVKVIHTAAISSSNKEFNLTVRDTQDTDLKLEIEKFDLNGRWSFKFKCFKVQKNTDYKLVFNNLSYTLISISSYRMSEFKIDQKKIKFDLNYKNGAYHFVSKIDFSIR